MIAVDDGGRAAADRCRSIGDLLLRVGDKWTVLVVMLLADQPRRYNELQRTIGGISPRMLTLTLRGLERDGLVARDVTPAKPPRVDYRLTALGRSLRKPVAALGDWAVANQHDIRAARARYDARQESGPAADDAG